MHRPWAQLPRPMADLPFSEFVEARVSRGEGKLIPECRGTGRRPTRPTAVEKWKSCTCDGVVSKS